MSRACGTHEGKRNVCRNLVEKHERNNHVKAIDVGMLSNETKRSTLGGVAWIRPDLVQHRKSALNSCLRK